VVSRVRYLLLVLCGGLLSAVQAGATPSAAWPAPGSQDAFIEKVRERYSSVRSMAAAFTQENEWELLEPEAPYHGHITVLADGRVNLRYDEPEGHTLVADGEHFWTYVPETGQVIKTSIEEKRAAVTALFLDFLSGHRIRAATPATDTVEIDLEPDPTLGLRRLTVVVDRHTYLGTSFTWTDLEGNTARYDLEGARINVDPDPDLFIFVVPDGVEVVELD
jgi:outer membrane lipoprotein-sorting protein